MPTWRALPLPHPCAGGAESALGRARARPVYSLWVRTAVRTLRSCTARPAMAAGQAPEALQADASIMHIACSGLSDTSDGTASRCKRISPLPPGLNQRAALLTAPLFNAKTAGVLQEVGGAPRGTRRPDSVPPMGCGSSARLAATPFALRRPANQSLGTPSLLRSGGPRASP